MQTGPTSPSVTAHRDFVWPDVLVNGMASARVCSQIALQEGRRTLLVLVHAHSVAATATVGRACTQWA